MCCRATSSAGPASRQWPPQRLKGLVASAYEHTAIAIGLARRAQAEAVALAAAKPALSDTQLTRLGRLTVQLSTVDRFAYHSFADDYEKLQDPETDASTFGPDNQALATYTTDLALECADFAHGFAGSQSLYVPNIIEKVMRDIHAASRHVAAQEVHYTDLARRLGTEARRWTKA